MAYSDFNWISDQLAIGGFVHEAEEAFPFDAVLSMETAAPVVLREFVRSGKVDYQWRSIIDGVCYEQNDDIVCRFNGAARQIHQWLADDKRVLVHCAAGVSRSVTAVTWYLMRYEHQSWDEVLELIRSKRPQANPNIRFEIPLRLAAGEELTDEWIGRRIEEECQHVRALGFEPSESEIWDALERQGTLQQVGERAG